VVSLSRYVRGLDAGLPRSVYVLQSGLVLNALGNGAAAPFLVIYLHDVRGLSLAVAALASSTGAVCALASALTAAAGDLETFTRLFLFNAATFLVYIAFVVRLPAVRPSDRAAARVGYREALRDRAFRGAAVVPFLLVAGGVALFASLFPVFAKNDRGVSERTIGVLFLLNSLLIIVAQLPIARAHEGHRRSTGLALTACLFAATWTIVFATGTLGGAAAVALLVVAVFVFAAGECIYDTVHGPLVADLAPEVSRGRYMAINGFAWQLGFTVGPGLGGLVLAAAGGALWPAAAAVCGLAARVALGLERSIPTRIA
jgi:predicted MFS family arabinose efflux permease